MEFNVEILTPSNEVLSTTASEVLIPSDNGEIGILPNHEDLIGLLSTGAMKIVSGGNDYWVMVSGGSFVVENGAVTLLAEYGGLAEGMDGSLMESRLSEVKQVLSKLSDTRSFEYQKAAEENARLEASQEVLRRHTMV